MCSEEGTFSGTRAWRLVHVHDTCLLIVLLDLVCGSRRRSKSWESSLLLPQTTSQLPPHTDGRSPVLLGWGALPQNASSCPPCSCLSSDPSVWARRRLLHRGWPWEGAGNTSLSKFISSVFPEQVWSTCGTSKIEGTRWGAGLAGVRGVDAYLFWAWVLLAFGFLSKYSC